MSSNQPDGSPAVSIVIVNWNTKDLILRCIETVKKMVTELPVEIFVVDNASSDGSPQAVREYFPDVQLIENDRNLGFAAANNMAFRQMSGKYALLLNSDAFLTQGALLKLFDFMEAHPDTAACCGQLLNADGSKQNSVASFPTLLTLLSNESLLTLLFPNKYPGKHKTYKAPVKVDSCIGACMLVRKTVMDQVGLLDENYFFFFEETDWAYRMKLAGFDIYFIPDAFTYHEQGQSVGIKASGRIMFFRSRYIYFKKWFPRLIAWIYLIIFLRLSVNTLLATIGVILCLGLNFSLNRRLWVYLQLIFWHLKGCP